MTYQTRRLAFSVAVLCLTLVGCATRTQNLTVPDGLVAHPCTANACTIQVIVDDCMKPGGIRVDKPLVKVTGGMTINWEIAKTEKGNFEFAENGILFPLPSEQQVAIETTLKANQFKTLLNKELKPGYYYYFVLVKGCLPLDPWVHVPN